MSRWTIRKKVYEFLKQTLFWCSSKKNDKRKLGDSYYHVCFQPQRRSNSIAINIFPSPIVFTWEKNEPRKMENQLVISTNKIPNTKKKELRHEKNPMKATRHSSNAFRIHFRFIGLGEYRNIEIGHGAVTERFFESCRKDYGMISGQREN